MQPEWNAFTCLIVEQAWKKNKSLFLSKVLTEIQGAFSVKKIVAKFKEVVFTCLVVEIESHDDKHSKQHRTINVRPFFWRILEIPQLLAKNL
jgi:hypothetical protein